MTYILSIDQGTSSSRAIIFDDTGKIVATEQCPLTLDCPQSGWVEFDVEAMWQSVLRCLRAVLQTSGLAAKQIQAIGITNQRETTIIWNKKTGKPIYPAIVWQDRRTAARCLELNQDQNLVEYCQSNTGLLIDPYFSATKIEWVLQNVSGARQLANQGDLAFGTVDCYLLWRLTGGQVHATDATNASRTLLYDIRQGRWDEYLLRTFSIPLSLLPAVKDCNAHFGFTDDSLLGHAIPITGIVGDQQAAAIGNGCIEPGAVKSTYGTGCFVLLNTGEQQVKSQHRLLSTIAYQVSSKVAYALEGSIFVAGAATGWLRKGLQLEEQIQDTQAMASSLPDNGGVYFVPALTGLGAPYWQPNARGVIIGLSLDVGVSHLVRAALEAVCYQTRDLLDVLQKDYPVNIKGLRVDGGMVKNQWLLQFLADICGTDIVRSECAESTALGAAVMAALGVGIFENLSDVQRMWRQESVYYPAMQEWQLEQLLTGWKQALQTLLA